MNTRRRKCKSCRQWFTPVRSGIEPVCSPACALEYVRAQRAKQRRKEHREAKRRLKTLPQLLKEAQTAFNAWIRLRDAGQPCICCGRWGDDDGLLTGSRWDAGHYRSVGAAAHLRFNEDNVHRQLVACNRHLSGNAVDFRLGLIARIGLERVEALEADNEPRKWSKDEVKAIRDTYRAKVREMKRRAA